jgi:hypothetical protein
MLNLDAIKFEVDTSDLVLAVEKLNTLRTSVSQLKAPVVDLARAEKLQAEAALAQAKAADVASKTMTRKAAAQKTLESATKAATSILQRQQDVLTFMASGFSKGQSGILASAKAAGQLSKELEDVLLAQRKLQGGDPFDKSQAGAVRLKNELAELKDEMRAAGAGIELTSKQYKELARDKMRLIEAAKLTGTSFSDLRERIREYQAEFITTALRVNELTAAEKARERASRDQANAIRAVANEEEKMANIMANMNNETDRHIGLSELAARRMANYQRNLRLSGVSMDEVTKKTAIYKTQLMQVMAVEEKRRMDHLSRALAPQISDVVVSLAGGMNPMTVLLQQGLQVRDLIGQSGVAADQLQKAFKTAAADMVSSIKGTVAALAALTFGAMVDAGKAVTSFAAKLPLIAQGVQAINAATLAWAISGVPGAMAFATAVGGLTTAFIALSSVGIIGVISAITGLMVATVASIREQSALSVAIASTGASLGLTAASATELAGSIEGISTTKGIQVLTEMGKSGGFLKSQFDEVAKAAVQMEKYAGQSIEKTVEQFKDIQKDPVEALAKLAAGNGQVEVAVLKNIQSLVEQGKTQEAVTLAMEAHAEALVRVAAIAEAEMHPMERLWIDIKTAIGGAWETLKEFARADAIIVPLRIAFDTIRGVIYDAWAGLRLMGSAIGGIVATIGAFSTGGVTAAAETIRAMKDDFSAGLKEREKYMKGLYNYEKKDPNKTDTNKTSKNAQDAAAFLKKLKDKKTGKTETEKADDKMQKFIDSMKAATEQAEVFDDSLTEADKALIKLQASEAWREGSPGMRKQAIEAAEAASKAQKYAAGIAAIKSALEGLNSANLGLELENSKTNYINSGMDPALVDQSLALDKESMNLQQEILKIRNMTVNEEAKIALIQTAQETSVKKMATISKEYYNNIQANIVASEKALQDQATLLAYEATLTGHVASEREKLLKIKQLELELERELAKIIDPAQQERMRQLYARKIEMVNKQAAVDLQSELVDGITDAVVTGLFEGGKAGRKKLRDLIVAELQKPITIYIKAVVNDIVGMMGGNGSNGTITSLISGVSSMYSAFTTAFGGGAGAASQTLIANEMAGGATAAEAGATAEAASAGTGATWASYASYAALIAIAIAVAENLYSKGWDRKAIGKESETVNFGGNTYKSDTSLQKIDKEGVGVFEQWKAKHLEWLGVSEKWVDILSGTVRTAATFGRKLKGVGYQANIKNGSAESVEGYAYYKGGVFRSDKTRKFDVSEESQIAVKGSVEVVKAAAKGMAEAMGLSSASIDNFTGTLRINMKGVDTAEEQSKRYSEALDKLYWNMLKTVDGLKMSKKAFEELQASALKLAESSGYSAQSITNALISGMTGQMGAVDVGAALSNTILGSIYNALAGGFAGQITSAITSLIIQPIMTSVIAGGTISSAVSQASIQAVVKQAEAAMNTFAAVVSSPEFQSMIGRIQGMINSIAGTAVKPAKHVAAFGNAVKGVGSSASTAKSQLKEAWKSIIDNIIDEIKRLKGEVIGENTQGLDYYRSQFAIKTAQARSGNQAAAKELPELSQTIDELIKLNAVTGYEVRIQQAQLMASLAQTAQLVATKYKIPLPSFDIGTNYVQKDMIAQIHEGEAIVPKRYNPDAGGGNSSLEARLEALIIEVQGLRVEVRADVSANTKTAKILERVSPDGESINTKVVT